MRDIMDDIEDIHRKSAANCGPTDDPEINRKIEALARQREKRAEIEQRYLKAGTITVLPHVYDALMELCQPKEKYQQVIMQNVLNKRDIRAKRKKERQNRKKHR